MYAGDSEIEGNYWNLGKQTFNKSLPLVPLGRRSRAVNAMQKLRGSDRRDCHILFIVPGGDMVKTELTSFCGNQNT